jgi:hypothetical protein
MLAKELDDSSQVATTAGVQRLRAGTDARDDFAHVRHA